MSPSPTPPGGIAGALAAIFPGVPVEFRAYDGSRTGPADAPLTVTVRSPKALSYMVTSPGEVGIARAYVSGELDLTGDVYDAITTFTRVNVADLSWGERLQLLRTVGPGVLRWVEPPPEEVGYSRVLRGLRHSRARDAQAISHHYDVSNRFYRWVLGPSMAYTCACYPAAEASLEQAQEHKFDLVCRKLGLQPGMRLLDVGCGWGGMVLHAVKHYGVTALGVTLSRQQAEWGQKAIAEEGLADVAEIRHSDYRDVRETGFDAISSIGLTEHIGEKQLPAYFDFLHSRLRPGGRLLNHCITRTDPRDGAKTRGFINRYVFPDGELEAVGVIVTAMQRSGFEPRHSEDLREHYARTLTAWSANLAAHWDEAVAEVGLPRAKVWALYLAGSRMGFETNRIQLHQVLAQRPLADGSAPWPLRPDWGV